MKNNILNPRDLNLSHTKLVNMKTYLKILPFVLILAASSPKASAQKSGVDSTGLPGDNFSLQGALEMFQKATSPEDFEKLLNAENNNVNNLDLNGDGETDYIKVIDKNEKNVHAFVLQVPVSENENQDIAVIELEKTGDSTAVIQIVGDEDIYGEQVIVEPGEEEGDDALLNGWNSSNTSGPAPSYGNGNTPRIIVNVWFWPSVRFIYGPVYRPWISPWRWRHYPGWYRPWRPVAWRVWHPRCVVHHRHFTVVHVHRGIAARRVYTPFRVTSVSVRTRHSASVNHYRVTRTKTTVTGPRGRSATRTTTTVSGKNGKVKASKTTVKRGRH